MPSKGRFLLYHFVTVVPRMIETKLSKAYKELAPWLPILYGDVRASACAKGLASESERSTQHIEAAKRSLQRQQDEFCGLGIDVRQIMALVQVALLGFTRLQISLYT